MRTGLARLVSRSILAIACLAPAGPALAASFWQVLVEPSSIAPDAGAGEALTGSIALEVATVPVVAPTQFHLTAASVTGASVDGGPFVLDPSVPSPGLGVVQANGSFLIPTLFLRGSQSGADLAVPNVEGTLLFDGGGSVVGLTSTFQVESGQVLTVNLVAVAPEPGSVLMALCAIGALAIVKERAR